MDAGIVAGAPAPLRRVLGTWSVVAFGVTNEIAAGLFFVSTQIQHTAPGTGDLVGWLMVAGGALTGATVIAYRYFFASGLVGAGGEYVIISRAIGRLPGFLATFLAWFGITGAIGTLSYSAPKFLANALQTLGLGGWGQAIASPAGTLVTGLLIIWGIWLVHVRGVRIAAALAVAAMCFVVAVASIAIVYGFATTQQTFALAMQAHLHLSVARVLAAAPVKATDPRVAFGTALPILFFGYLGLSAATQTGGEALDAPRTLSRGVVIAVCLVTTIYTLFAFAIYHAVPWRLIAGLAAMNLTTYTTSTGLLGLVMPPWLASLMNVFVAAIVVKTFVPLFLAQSRWIYAWAADGIIPVRFAHTHSRFGTPVLALTVSAILGSLSLLESIAQGYVFGVNVRVLSAMVVFFFIGAGIVAFRRAGRRAAYLAVAAVVMGFSLWFAISIALSGRNAPLLLQPIVQAAIVAVAGLLIYAAGSAASRARTGRSGQGTS